MANSFGIPQIVDFLTHMGLCIANVDQDQEIIELAFHGDNGQWRLIINIQQSEEIRKLMFIVPHFGGGYFHETLMLGHQAKNVYVDTSSSNSWIRLVPGLTLENIKSFYKSFMGASTGN